MTAQQGIEEAASISRKMMLVPQLDEGGFLMVQYVKVATNLEPRLVGVCHRSDPRGERFAKENFYLFGELRGSAIKYPVVSLTMLGQPDWETAAYVPPSQPYTSTPTPAAASSLIEFRPLGTQENVHLYDAADIKAFAALVYGLDVQIDHDAALVELQEWK